MHQVKAFFQKPAFTSTSWYAIIVALLLGWYTYINATGWNMFSFTGQEKWSASGANGSGHK